MTAGKILGPGTVAEGIMGVDARTGALLTPGESTWRVVSGLAQTGASASAGAKAVEVIRGKVPSSTPPSLSAHKEALGQVHAEVGKLPKGEPGKWGAPQAGDTTKGYRLDPPHPGRAASDPESKPHFNWWDWTGGKRGTGGRSGVVPIED